MCRSPMSQLRVGISIGGLEPWHYHHGAWRDPLGPKPKPNPNPNPNQGAWRDALETETQIAASVVPRSLG